MSGKRREITYKINENGCHICDSHRLNTHGYPELWSNGRGHNMHRILYKEKYGEIKKGFVVRHKCDERQCIKLDHLELGTPGDNSRDCKARGRLNTSRGEERSDCKLSDVEVLEIRRSKGFQIDIARKYGIAQSTVSRIKSGKKRGFVSE